MPIKPFVFVAILLTAILNNTQAQVQVLDEIAGMVGDKIILASEIELQYLQAQAQGMNTDNLKCQIVDQMMLEKLFSHQAEIDSIVVEEGDVELEIDSRLNYFINMFGGDVEKMEEYYGKSMTQIKDGFRKEVRDQMMARRMQQQVIGDVKVTPSEVKRYFEMIPKDSLPYLDAELELSEIIIKPKLSPAAKLKTKQELLDLKQRITGGESFEKLAKAFSQDPGSGANGGDLGWVGRGQFVPAFETVAYKLKPGELSEPVESEYGYHLIELLEKRGDKIHARHILLKPATSYTDMQAAKQRADSIRNLVLIDSLTFKKAIEKFNDDEESKKRGGLVMNIQKGTTVFSMKELDPTVYFVVDTLQQGETAAPIEYTEADGSKTYHIYHLISRTKPHIANLKDDYSKIQNIVESRKKQESLLKWLDTRLPKTYVFLSNRYQSCGEGKWNKQP
jgi:peptidyl-prolyl cis-trans isomerase SurA